MRRARLLVLGVSTMLLSVAELGCTYYDDRGPRYAPSPAPDEGYGLVYVYRPKQQWGAIFQFTTMLDERPVGVWSGQYAVIVATAGTVDLPHIGKVTTSRSKPAFVRVEFDELVDSWNPGAGVKWEVAVVEREEAESDLDGLRLGAGGRGRYPDRTEPQAALSAAPSASPPATVGPAPSAAVP